MGYWGYEATESDSALDAMFKIIALLEKMWDEATDYGEKMAVVYVLTEAPQVDGADYRGLKAKAVAFVEDCQTRLYAEDLRKLPVGEYCEAFDKRYAQNTYLQGLVWKLQEKQGATLIKKLTGYEEMEIVLDKEASKHR